ncbi:MAG: AAA family ATPase, partial [Chloroflexota bacterium]
MSPELLTGDPASIQSDLYAIGVMLYQLLTGNYPYNQRNLGVLVQEIMNTPPDTSMLLTRLQRVVDRLLMKQPDYRYQQAQDVIDDLAKAINTPLRVDKRALRESYLQAARFVGRDEELRTLRTALKNTLAGVGSQWLIGGESGIGKSRLLEELRTLALVEGATVLRGQSVTGGERRFYMWLDILRQLALMVDISDDEASILKTILPDLDTLLQRETPSERSLRGVQGQQLLVRTIVAVLTRYDKPLIILLEDLHWAGNSLDVLQQLSAQAQDMPYLIVGTYRDDERPDLPVHLSEMDVIRLSRLDAMSIEQLSAAMLGTAGKQPHVLKLLQEETEGNVFFMVEIVRALAEDAGRLDAIGQQPLPQNILTGGVQQVVQRRLDRLPDTVRTWLNAVAIAGRQLDLPVVNELTDDTLDLTSTLMLCSNVAVLTVEGNSWRFAHDKIRESIINALSDADHARYNQQVAEATERVYPEDDSRVAILLEHWLAAHIPDKIITYTAAGVHQMLKQGYIEDALAYAEHALPYMPDGSFARMDLYTRLGLIYRIIYNMRASQAQYKEALSLARALAHTEGLVKALCGLATVHVEMMNDLEQAQSYVDEALALSGDDIKLQEDALMAAGRVAAAMRDFDTAKAHYEASLRIHQQRGNRQRIANTLNQLGLIAMRRGDLAKAHAHLSESITIVEEVGNYFSTTKQLQNLIDLEGWRGNFDAQRTHAKHVIALWREHNARPQMAEGYFSLAHIEMSRSDYESAREYLEKGTHIVQQTEQTMEAAWFNYGWLARLEESYTEAMLSFSKALAICTEMGNQHAQ